MKQTKHFSSEEWIDFVKGALPAQLTETMQQHLEKDCQRCSKLFETWSLVNRAAQREADYQVPESALRHVQNAFDIAAEPAAIGSLFEIPRLVFDSLWQPALAGVRSGEGAPRHLLYKSGEISIELVLEHESPSDRVHIAGQVSRGAADQEALPQVPVILGTGDRQIVEASTNRHGEFQLAFVPEVGLRLSFGRLMGKNLTIPLDGTGMRTFLRP